MLMFVENNVRETTERFKLTEMKAEKEGKMKSKKADGAREKPTGASASETVSDDETPNELRAPQWSVVSFERREAANLTYEEASEKMKELAARKVSGLCIITDQAAQKA